MIFFDVVSRSQQGSSPAHAPVTYAAQSLPTNGVESPQDLDYQPSICTSGSTSSNTSLILFLLVSCAYPRFDRRAVPPPCHLEIASARPRVNGLFMKRGTHNHGRLYPLHGVRQTEFGQKLLPASYFLFLLSPPLRTISVSRCYLSLS